jgi:hypothetical protein
VRQEDAGAQKHAKACYCFGHCLTPWFAMHGWAAITKWRYIALRMVANMIKPSLFERSLDNADWFHGVFARKQIWFRPCFVGNPGAAGCRTRNYSLAEAKAMAGLGLSHDHGMSLAKSGCRDFRARPRKYQGRRSDYTRLGGVVLLRQLIRHELSSAAFLPGGCWRGCRGGRSLLVSAGERLLESFEFGA